jgi:hypothetical protein
MIRRRRPQRDIAFSFDSFLDVVANVVGIILRLILVAWVGAKSYKAFVPAPPPPAAAEDEVVAVPAEAADPLAGELPRRQAELERARARLQEQARAGREVDEQASIVERELAEVKRRRQQLEEERAAQAKAANDPSPAKGAAASTLAEMNERIAKLQRNLADIARAPVDKQTLRYRTPVSKPLQTDELLFECREGRVTLIDIGRLLEDARRRIRDKGELLRHQWQVEEETDPVGAFRLHFVVERERNPIEEFSPGTAPDERTNFRYGISSWKVVPLDPKRGETAEQALAPGSAFRKVVDAIDPNETAVTFWVYPDSFATYRTVRDALYDRDVVVAGRPLPEGYPISASSRHGTASRGQ